MAAAADIVRARGITTDSELGPLFDSPPPGADAEVLKRLRQMYEAGGWVLVESGIADMPADLRWLFESGAVTLEQLAAVHRALGATSAADLAAAIHDQRMSGAAGLDATVESAIASALPTLRTHIPRIPLGRAIGIAEPILHHVRSIPGVQWAEPAGSLRRGEELIGDIELIVSTDRAGEAIDEFLRGQNVTRTLHRSPRRLYVLIDRVQVGIRFPEPDNAGASLLYLTGSAAHFDALRAHAQSIGWRLTSRGLHAAADGALRPAPTEAEIYSALGLPWVPPEIRQGEDEVAIAARGELPVLVASEDIRGDLHMHSTYSDGRDSIDAMVEACRALGYEYMAITDHSQHSAATRSLTVDGVKRQADEIAALRERFDDITILHGCEVDILIDGTLDFPDRVLEQFDIVLASLHERAGQEGDKLLKRYLAAMRHPLVTMITHPTNRLVPYREGYDLDYDRLFEAAAETKTILEVDGAPAHLDLDGALARRAVAAGAMVSVDSDSHRTDVLERQMYLGIVTARRGWVEPRHVANTRSIADLRALIAAKR